MTISFSPIDTVVNSMLLWERFNNPTATAESASNGNWLPPNYAKAGNTWAQDLVGGAGSYPSSAYGNWIKPYSEGVWGDQQSTLDQVIKLDLGETMTEIYGIAELGEVGDFEYLWTYYDGVDYVANIAGSAIQIGIKIISTTSIGFKVVEYVNGVAETVSAANTAPITTATDAYTGGVPLPFHIEFLSDRIVCTIPEGTKEILWTDWLANAPAQLTGTYIGVSFDTNTGSDAYLRDLRVL